MDSKAQQHESDIAALRDWWLPWEGQIPQGAAERLREWLDDHPDDSESVFWLSIVYGSDRERFAGKNAERIELLRRAAAAGHSPAKSKLAIDILSGRIPPAEPGEAVQLLSEAAREKDPCALYGLGQAYLFGIGGMKQNFQKAKELLREAVGAGFVRAYSPLGFAEYASGDKDAALRTFREGAQAGDADSKMRVALHLKKTDPPGALRLMLEAAEKPHSDAYREMGKFFIEGIGSPRNPRKAFRCFETAAKQGDVEGRYLYGRAYLEGTGVDRDLPAAVRELTAAMESGSADAALCLAKSYLTGDPLAADKEKGRQLLRRAAKMGSKEAQTMLATLE